MSSVCVALRRVFDSDKLWKSKWQSFFQQHPPPQSMKHAFVLNWTNFAGTYHVVTPHHRTLFLTLLQSPQNPWRGFFLLECHSTDYKSPHADILVYVGHFAPTGVNLDASWNQRRLAEGNTFTLVAEELHSRINQRNPYYLPMPAFYSDISKTQFQINFTICDNKWCISLTIEPENTQLIKYVDMNQIQLWQDRSVDEIIVERNDKLQHIVHHFWSPDLPPTLEELTQFYLRSGEAKKSKYLNRTTPFNFGII